MAFSITYIRIHMPTRPQKVTYSYEAHTDCLKMATKPKCVYVYISNLIGFPNIQELPFKNSEQRRKCDNRGKTRHLFNSCVYSLQRPINMWIFFLCFVFCTWISQNISICCCCRWWCWCGARCSYNCLK